MTKIIVAGNMIEGFLYRERMGIPSKDSVIVTSFLHVEGLRFTREDVHYTGSYRELAEFPEISDYIDRTVVAYRGLASIRDNETRTTSATGGQKGVKPERFSLIPKAPLDLLGRVYHFGESKYAPHNYRKGYEWSKSYDALQRHLSAWWEREDIDEESGLSHLGHAACHIFALIVFSSDRDRYGEYDDRYSATENSEPIVRPQADNAVEFVHPSNPDHALIEAKKVEPEEELCEYRVFWSAAKGEYECCKHHNYESSRDISEGPNRPCNYVDEMSNDDKS